MYVNEVNKGVVYSRNRAFDLAAGRYIAILDGDDVWEKTKLEKQYDVLKDDAIDLCYSSYSYINEHSTPIRYIYHTREAGSYRSLLRENYIGCSTAVIKAYIAKNVKMNGNVSHEDYYYWLNLLKQDVAARGIDEPLVRYRIHSKSRSYNKIKAARNRFIIYYKYLDLGVFKSTFFLLVYFIKAAKKYFNIYMKKRY
jgi:teichuronic acid biosynthesis glycosyltransferase TuaG